MNRYGLLLAPILVVALCGCGLDAAISTTATTTESPLAADRPAPRPAPAAAGTLAYVLGGDVYVADQDGSNEVKIANGHCAPIDGYTFWAEGLMWSPDGRYLAYRRMPCPATRKDWGDVVISDAAGNVTAMFPADGWDIGWSPDSTRVAVWEVTFETVGVYGVDGARQVRLAMPPGWTPTGDHDPVWMPDGTLVVQDVELPLDGGAPKAIGGEIWSRVGCVCNRPDSPDGSQIAYVGHGVRSLMVTRSDGSGSTTLLTAERGTSLGVIGFSAEGDRILFWRTEDSKTGETGESSLWSIGADGSHPRLVVAGTMDGEWLSR